MPPTPGSEDPHGECAPRSLCAPAAIGPRRCRARVALSPVWISRPWPRRRGNSAYLTAAAVLRSVRNGLPTRLRAGTAIVTVTATRALSGARLIVLATVTVTQSPPTTAPHAFGSDRCARRDTITDRHRHGRTRRSHFRTRSGGEHHGGVDRIRWRRRSDVGGSRRLADWHREARRAPSCRRHHCCPSN